MSADRKDDHVRLAAGQQQSRRGYNEFDDVTLLHHALAGIDRADVSLATGFGPIRWDVPLYINAMTGGSTKTGAINRDLAIAARETGVPVATGSMSPYFADPSVADTFAVMRRENPNGFILANVNATATVDNARRAVELIGADALQIHLNTIQEIVMPEGDRSFSAWPARIGEIAAAVGVPVIVKEVGFGLSRRTVAQLNELGVTAADVGGRGGTNFAEIENSRRAGGEYGYLTGWGQSTPACLLDAADAGLPLLGSGGVRNPLDVVRVLALGGAAGGVSGAFLATLLDDGVAALIERINTWLDQITALLTVLGARTPADAAHCDVLVGGDLRVFCADRGIDTARLADRSAPDLGR